jgi:putative PIN family toxin of toxin-antitoxin system
MRIVLDTNVMVSALIHPGRKPARVLELVLRGELTLLVEERVLDEYAGVLARPRFGLPRHAVAEVLDSIRRDAERVLVEPLEVELPDPDDLKFLELAVSGQADVLITGNTRHFPPSSRHGVEVLTPARFLEQAEGP